MEVWIAMTIRLSIVYNFYNEILLGMSSRFYNIEGRRMSETHQDIVRL